MCTQTFACSALINFVTQNNSFVVPSSQLHTHPHTRTHSPTRPPHHSCPSEVTRPTNPHPSSALMGLQERRGTKASHTRFLEISTPHTSRLSSHRARADLPLHRPLFRHPACVASHCPSCPSHLTTLHPLIQPQSHYLTVQPPTASPITRVFSIDFYHFPLVSGQIYLLVYLYLLKKSPQTAL